MAKLLSEVLLDVFGLMLCLLTMKTCNILRNKPASQLFHLPLQTDPCTEARSNIYILSKQVALATECKTPTIKIPFAVCKEIGLCRC